VTVSRAVDVLVDGSDATPALVGRLYLTRRGDRESASFVYDQGFVVRHDAYAIDPQLPVGAGRFHTAVDQKLFRALADTAPDRWGVELARRDERRRARSAGTTRRSLGEADLLLRVPDRLRQGALRLREPESGAFLAPEGAGVPRLVDLTRLLSASINLERESDTDEDLRLLLLAGSSLGGARPKANVRDGDHLSIAKFPRVESDPWSVIVWEQIALDLARACGLRAPTSRLEVVDGRPVLLVERFDRSRERRIGYVSALTMLEARDNEHRSYLEIVEVIERHSPRATSDLQELWRRVAFSILISNTDDHLRNHGFLRAENGWTLSPVFDVNPDPDGAGLLSTGIEDGDNRSASVTLLVDLAGYFRVTAPRDELRRLIDGAGGWRALAQRYGVGREIDRLEAAFAHDRLDEARRLAI
jgi:serine/threonine-protein kinase HipA